MSLFSAADLSKVKLKKGTPTNDASAPKLTGFISDDQVKEYQGTVLDINLEEWVHLIEDHTFATSFHALTTDDAHTFIACYEHFDKEKNTDFSEELKAKLEKIRQRLETAIEEMKGDGECVFVKTSSRSAKDTGIYQKKFREVYVEFLKQQPSRGDNDKLVALLLAGTEMLKMRSAYDVIQNFAISERVCQDMNLALSNSDRFKEHFIIRKWVDMSPDMEFRAFYCNGKLNAMGQYNHLPYYPHLIPMREEIQERILKFFHENIQQKLDPHFKNCVIDFALAGKNFEQVWVIELNPFLPTTDGGLFSWKEERELLENGPFEFRLRTHYASGTKAMISVEWRQVFDMEVPE